MRLRRTKRISPSGERHGWPNDVVVVDQLVAFIYLAGALLQVNALSQQSAGDELKWPVKQISIVGKRANFGFELVTLDGKCKLVIAELAWAPRMMALPGRRALHLQYVLPTGQVIHLVEAAHLKGIRCIQNSDEILSQGYFPFTRPISFSNNLGVRYGYKNNTDVAVAGPIPDIDEIYKVLKLKY